MLILWIALAFIVGAFFGAVIMAICAANNAYIADRKRDGDE